MPKKPPKGTSKVARITVTAVERLGAGDIIRDTEVKGFGVRRQQDEPVYFLRKKVNGRDRWIAIGVHGSPWTPETARKEATRLLGTIADGVDPATAKRHRLDNPTVREAATLFLEEHGPRLKPTTLAKYSSLFRLYILPEFGTRRIMDIQRADIVRFQSKLIKMRATYNYIVAVISKLMNWAEDASYRERNTNPCVRITKFKQNKRQRYLSQVEFSRLGEVLANEEGKNPDSLYPVMAVKLLMVTGARLSEILTLKWSFVDFDNKLLLLPDSKTGQKHITLNAIAIDLLEAIPRVQDNPYVIVGRRPKSHLVNLQKAWRYLRKKAKLDDVRLHDLRHSYASIAATSGGSLPMIGKLLGHRNATTTERYAHLTDDPARELNEKVGERIAKATAHKGLNAARQLAYDEGELKRLEALLTEAKRIRALEDANAGIQHRQDPDCDSD